MARRIQLFLVRHAVSEANLDKSVNARLPDARVPLAPEGHNQAYDAGKALATFLKSEDNIFHRDGPMFRSPLVGKTRILCSPYQRTRETSAGVERGLQEAGIDFDKREEIALREISFGLFDGIADEELPMEFPREHAHYQKYVDFEGEFYAPMPLGESRAQVADRVKGVFGTIIRDNAPLRHKDPVSNFIIVSHGVTIRAFMMQWMHKTPEWYQEQVNPANASVMLIHPTGEDQYDSKIVFGGFRPIRTKQDMREEGHVD